MATAARRSHQVPVGFGDHPRTKITGDSQLTWEDLNGIASRASEASHRDLEMEELGRIFYPPTGRLNPGTHPQAFHLPPDVIDTQVSTVSLVPLKP